MAGNTRIAIVGAGLAGAMAARTLAENGTDVTVFEKSRAPGGRAATRHQGDERFDHGAQYFTQRDPRTAALMSEWRADGVVAPWTARLAARDAGAWRAVAGDETRWVGVPGMRSLGAHVARALPVRYGATVTSIERLPAGGWRVCGAESVARSTAADPEGDSTLGTFSHVLVTAPAAQTHALLAPHDPQFAATLASVQMLPCIAAMIVLADAPDVDWDGAFVNDDPVLSWVARNASKPGRPVAECWVLHATPAWSQAHLDHEPATLVAPLLRAFGNVVGRSLGDVAGDGRPVRTATVHRWRYAIPDAESPRAEQESYYDSALGLGAAGDWCVGGRVEGALLSGLSLARRVLRDVSRRPER